MSTEIVLSKMLEKNGFEKKQIKREGWSYEHSKCLGVVYNKKYIWFNDISKYMRDTVKQNLGTIIGLDNSQKEQLYRKALARLEFYDEIKNYLIFSLRAKGVDYVGISEIVSLNILSKILEQIIANDGIAIEKKVIQKHAVTNTQNLNLPQKKDSDFALQQITDCSVKAILDQIEHNFIAEGKPLRPSWRIITEMNIKKYWYK